MPKVKYILLDCDNTLVQSERLAFEACTDLTNEVLEKHNISHRYTVEQLLEDFVGHNFRGMLKGLQATHNFRMDEQELEDYVNMEVGKVCEKLMAKAVECPGVTEQLNWAKSQGYPMAVVSTSAKPRVVASLEKVKIDGFFPNKHVYSAATSLNPPSSKPDPAVYLFACKELGVEPHECVTVEDSKSGATAAMRAGIPCIGYVGIYGIEESKEKEQQMAKLLKEQTKCKTIMYDWSEFQQCLAEVEASN